MAMTERPSHGKNDIVRQPTQYNIDIKAKYWYWRYCYVIAIVCLFHYWLNREKWFSIIRLYIVTILSSESCVLCIVMRPKHCHLCITFFLDTEVVLALKGPLGKVL